MTLKKAFFANALICICTLQFASESNAYDFTNFVTQQKAIPLPVNGQAIKSKSSSTFNNSNNFGQDIQSDRTIVPGQTPISWFFAKLYGNESPLEGDDGRRLDGATKMYFNMTDENLPQNGNGTALKDTLPAEESIKYNVSHLGLLDPFAKHSTKLSYDYKIEVGEPHNNGKGSIVSLLNGTIFPLGSVGAMSALGWRGGTNETHKPHAPGSNSTINSSNSTSSVSQNSTTHGNQTKTTNTTSIMPQDGLSGIWLAFTSQHALTGGYTLHSKQLSVANNAVYHNVTFRSNFTIDAHGVFDFTFTIGVVDERDQYLRLMAKNSTINNKKGRSGGGGGRMNNDEPVINPIRLEGPKCVELKGMNNTEAVFRMRCKGNKVHLFADI
ncbi:uncharacterized protein FA14DRAFT_177699 [Meira miltonrushii]|uniref:Uncharacterized protein n=1 Tax=Meira miltonrushii TaxID=1280837 RepID=A0A316VMA8_9BASI|nr:uncharacterized protein FA14DRAFT_177699 [Meira miltonrushii]PWN38424.1 hypothetical protein FA14DRAFT_177699 [Meira miltonrushii]